MHDSLLLEMKGIVKAFPGVRALSGVNFDLRVGEVHALLGENGAGKSTLIKILGGIYTADEGEIRLEGKLVNIRSVAAAQHIGIRIIHQEIVLVPYMTVAENIWLGREQRTNAGFLDKREMLTKTRQIIQDYCVDIPADELVGNLSLGQQQLVEIMRAVSADANIIVMDEPTSSLTEHEIKILFRTIRRLKEKGVGIIYISHKISELFEITDRITILRDGVYIDTVETSSIETNDLISMMVGRKLEKYYTKTNHAIGKTTLEVLGLSKQGMFRDISFHVKSGEIIGFYGLMGAGRSEVMKTIFGCITKDSGTTIINDLLIDIRTPSQAIDSGIAYLPENRKEEGLVLMNTVGYNMTLVALKQIIKSIGINQKERDGIINRYVEAFNIKITSSEQIVGNLSGGNQQKVILGKWLAINPKILILDEPTRGIDVGAKADIYRIIDQLAENGVSIILISSEMPEIINMCDRVYIMSEGEITAELDHSELTQETIMIYSAGGIKK